MLVACSETTEHTPIAKAGRIDISKHEFIENPYVTLDGAWDFYWNELLTPQQIATGTYDSAPINVPISWANTKDSVLPNFGYATYQLKVKAPSNAPRLVFQTKFIASNCKIYIDDALIMQQGDVGKRVKESSYNSMPIHLELPPVQDSFRITIQVSNFKTNRSGLLYHTFLGDEHIATKGQKQQIFYGLAFWGGTFFIALLLIGCYFIFSVNESIIYLGLAFLSFGYWRTSADMKIFNIFFIDFDWEWSIRLELLGVILTFFFLAGSMEKFYTTYAPKVFAIILQSVQLIFVVLVLIAPITWVFELIFYHLFVVFASIVYMSIIIKRAIKDKRHNIWFVLVALITTALASSIYVVMDIFYHQGDSIYFLLEFLFLGSLLLMVLYQQFSNIVKLGQKANAAIEAKERFLSVISHEMRTPMNGILVVSDLLEKTPLNEEQQGYITTLQSSGKNLTALIEDLLDNTRIKEGKLQIQHKVFDVHALFQETIHVCHLLLDQKHVVLRLHLDENAPRKAIGDSKRIKQVLDNLIDNAIKFTEDGSVDVFVSAQAIDDDQFTLQCNVKDTGIGIETTVQNEIFEQFSQANSNLNREYGGIGLGLSICKQLVDLMKGNISVESEKGKGSVFSFEVPLNRCKERINEIPKSPPLAEENQAEKTLQILIVEDNMINLKLLGAGLKKLGYASDSAANGRLGVEATQAQDYDLIFMDVQMPVMDGLEATRLIKQNSTNPPHIVVLTANAFPEDKIAAYEAGADGFLAKPFKLNTIEAIIKQLEQDKLPISPAAK